MTVCLEYFKKMLGEKLQFGLSPRALEVTGRETVANSGDRRQLLVCIQLPPWGIEGASICAVLIFIIFLMSVNGIFLSYGN